MTAKNIPDTDSISVLKLIKTRHNVLVSGVPASGKSLLLGKVAHWFVECGRPAYRPEEKIVFPDGSHPKIEEWLPSPERKNRKVFRMAFHQGTKYRDFVRGIVPDIRPGKSGFRVTTGILLEAAEFARGEDNTALVVIDEINRGHAVQIFGDSIVALDTDKRLTPDGKKTITTQPFSLLDEKGEYGEYTLPFHLYLVAAMNQADTSIDPIDVAFLRRLGPYRIEPDFAVLAEYFDLKAGRIEDLKAPDKPAAAADVYGSLVLAWGAVNDRLRLGRGEDFMIGHGILMDTSAPPNALDEALLFAASAWHRVYAHINEVFFGDVRGAAATLNITGQKSNGHPLSLEDTYFGETAVLQITGNPRPAADVVYLLLRAVCKSDEKGSST